MPRLNVAPLKNGGQSAQGLAIVLDDLTETKRLQSKYEVFKRMVPPAVINRLDFNNECIDEREPGQTIWRPERLSSLGAADFDADGDPDLVGLHSRGNDLAVNPIKGKQLTNIRASGTDEALTLTPPIRHTLEQALEFIEDDELVEVTPLSIRLRKKLLLEHERRRASRA